MVARPVLTLTAERIPSLLSAMEAVEETLSPPARTEFGRVVHDEALDLLLRTATTHYEAATVALRQVAQMMSNHPEPHQQKMIDDAVAAVLPVADRHLGRVLEKAGGSGIALIAMVYAIADVIQNGDPLHRPPMRHRIQ